MSIQHLLGPVELATWCLFLFSYSQNELVAGEISSAVYNHPSLKELTTGRWCGGRDSEEGSCEEAGH